MGGKEAKTAKDRQSSRKFSNPHRQVTIKQPQKAARCRGEVGDRAGDGEQGSEKASQRSGQIQESR